MKPQKRHMLRQVPDTEHLKGYNEAWDSWDEWLKEVIEKILVMRYKKGNEFTSQIYSDIVELLEEKDKK